MNLTEKYRPRTLADVVGQPWAVEQLREFTENPVSCAFLFEGSTGIGKTSAALALANDLGVDTAAGPPGGLHQIASGEQTGETVRRTMSGLRLYTSSGSGWKVLIVNEADCMSDNAAFVWLDALEHLPPRTVVVFTTNRADRIARRLRDRCECFKFESGYITLAADLGEFIARVWKAETGRDDAPALDDLGAVQDDEGNVSVRRVLQLLTPLVRKAGKSAKPVAHPVQRSAALTNRIRKNWLPDRPASLTKQVAEYLANSPGEHHRMAIETALGGKSVGSALASLVKQGEILMLGKGMYRSSVANVVAQAIEDASTPEAVK